MRLKIISARLSELENKFNDWAESVVYTEIVSIDVKSQDMYIFLIIVFR